MAFPRLPSTISSSSCLGIDGLSVSLFIRWGRLCGAFLFRTLRHSVAATGEGGIASGWPTVELSLARAASAFTYFTHCKMRSDVGVSAEK